MMHHGGYILVQSLLALGARHSFGVPGESYLAALDALYDTQGQFDYMMCRNEGGASFMAAAYGKLTQSPGLCWVTRGPGASNAAIGVHTAFQDSAPMILFIGQVARDQIGREAFQEIDYKAMFGSVAKWAVQIDQVERIPEILAKAWSRALSGRLGPVVIALPEDMLSQRSDVKPLCAPAIIQEAAPNPQAVDKFYAILGKAKRPLLLLGGCNWTTQGRNAIEDFAQRSKIPCLVGFRYQDQFDNHSPVYAGEAGVAMPAHIRDLITHADTIIAINSRLGEMSTGAFELLKPPKTEQKLIHVHSSDFELGKTYQPALAIHAGPNEMAQALQHPVTGNWVQWCKNARSAYLTALQTPPQSGGAVDMGAISAWLRENLPEDVIVTNGAGNFTLWPNKFLQYGTKARLLAPQSGAMGYGLPAAIMAKYLNPQRMVLCFAGDGDFQMNCQELATAQQYGAQPIVLVVNNGRYGTIRAHQDRMFPNRVMGTTMQGNPDFVTLAKAYDMHAERITKTDDFAAAFERAVASKTGAVLDLHTN